MPERRTLVYQGRKWFMTELASEAGINYQTLRSRLKKGWSIERAVETPAKPRNEARLVHGQCCRRRSKEYRAWQGMKHRCSNLKRHNAHRYVLRGIRVCLEFEQDFAAFFEHVGPAPSPKHSLGRIDNNRGYEPGNLRWETASEQARNRGGYYEERRRLKEGSKSGA